MFMRQGVTLPETPRERRELDGLSADLEDSPMAGRPLPLRLRNFRPSAEGYLASLGGPLAYMLRLRQIDGSPRSSSWRSTRRGEISPSSAQGTARRSSAAGATSASDVVASTR